jgi:alpha-galactosidase
METRGVVAMAGTFGYEMDLSKTTDQEKTIIARQVKEFKAHAQLIREGDYYRLTDPMGSEPYTAWACVAPDRRSALVSIVGGPVFAAPPFSSRRIKGLDPALTYRVNGEACFPGDALMLAGYPLPIPQGDYPSLQLFLEAL